AQAGADVEALQHADPALGPPALPEGAALRLGLDAALGRARAGFGEPREVVPGTVAPTSHGYSPIAVRYSSPRPRFGGEGSIERAWLFSDRLLPQGEEVLQLRVRQLRQPALAGADDAL